MFAVIILGIGFIMVAAIFPVALQQAKSTTEETNAAAIASGFIRSLGGTLNDGATPTTTSNCPAKSIKVGTDYAPGIVQVAANIPPSTPGVTPLWKALSSDLINRTRADQGTMFLYQRKGDSTNATTWSASATVFVFSVAARAQTKFSGADVTFPSDVTPSPSPTPETGAVPNLMPRSVRVAVSGPVVALGGSSFAVFDTRTSLPPIQQQNVDAADVGAYLIIADDKVTGNIADAGQANGFTFKLGNRRTDLENGNSADISALMTAIGGGWSGGRVVFELEPGNDFKPFTVFDTSGNARLINAIGNTAVINPSQTKADSTAEAFVIGRGYAPDWISYPAGTPRYEGPSMATGRFTSFITVNK